MSLKFLRSAQENPTHIVRLLMPHGVYPKQSVITEDSILHVSDEICFSICPYQRDYVDSEHYYSDVDWATFSELRLYSSVLLSGSRKDSFCCIYPFRYGHYIQKDDFDVSHYEDVLEVEEILIKAIACAPINWNSEYRVISRGIYHSKTENFMPPILGGDKYDLTEKGYREELQEEVFAKFDMSDYLFMRGVSTLMRSVMLSRHLHFMEEAINTTFISLEASFRLVLNKLKSEGVKNPTSTDAADYIAKTFNSPSAGKYFEEYYDSRIMSFHPESRFGIFPHAPLMHDDHYDLFNDLLGIYLFLITGYVDTERWL